MSGFLPLVFLAGLVLLGFLGFVLYQRSVDRRRLLARLMPHTVSPRDAATPIWMRAGLSEELLGLRLDEASIPVWIRWMGTASRRAGFRFGSLDVLILTLLVAFAVGAVVNAYWANTTFTLGSALLGAAVPNLVLVVYGNRRVRRMEEQLADMLDATVGALRAGIGLRQALEVVRGSRRPPIAAVLNAVLSLTDLGLPLAEAFRQTTLHLRSKHFNMLLIALDANAEAGSSLSPMLKGMADRIRDSIRMRRRIRSLTAEARFSIIALFAILYGIAFMIWTFRPQNLVYLWTHPLGRSLVTVAVLMQIFGVAWTMYLVRSKE